MHLQPERLTLPCSQGLFTLLSAEVVQFLSAVLAGGYHHPPVRRVERSEGRALHWIQRVIKNPTVIFAPKAF